MGVGKYCDNRTDNRKLIFHFHSPLIARIIVFSGKHYVQDIIPSSRFWPLGREVIVGTESRKLGPMIKRNRSRDEATRDHCRWRKRRRRESDEQRGRSRVPRALGCRDGAEGTGAGAVRPVGRTYRIRVHAPRRGKAAAGGGHGVR